MGIVIRQSGYTTTLTYLGAVIGYVNVIILFPGLMEPGKVGLTRLIQDVAMLLVPLAQLGIGQLVVRFLPAWRQRQQQAQFTGFVMIMLVLALLLFSALFYLLIKPFLSSYLVVEAPEAIGYLDYMLAFTLILAVYQVQAGLAQTNLNIVLPGFLKEIQLRLLTLAGILLYAGGILDFTGFINLLLAAYLLNVLVLGAYLLAKGTLQMKAPGDVAKEWRPVLTYALFSVLGAGSMLIIGKVDSIMVSAMLDLQNGAVYTTAFYIAVMIDLPKRAVARISMPLIADAFARNDNRQIADLYRKSAINNLIIGGLIFIGLWINLDNIFALIPRSEVYGLGRLVVVLIGAGKLIDMAAGINGEILVMSRHYRVNVWLLLLLALVTVVANYLLIPRFGLAGAAIGSVLALLIFNLGKFLFLYFRLQLQPFTYGTIKVILVGAVVLTSGLLLPALGNRWLDILYRSGLISLLYGVSIYLLGVSPELNSLARRLFKPRR